MDIKLAKFAPLAVGGLFVLHEFLILVFGLRFNVFRYVFPEGLYISIWPFISLIAFALKVIFVLGLLFHYKMYTERNISKSKVLAGILIVIFYLQIIPSALLGNRYYIPFFIRLLELPLLILLIANLIIALTARDRSAPQKPHRQPRYRMPIQMAQQGQSIPDQLAALQALVDAGTLTQAEFKAAKQRIIGG